MSSLKEKYDHAKVVSSVIKSRMKTTIPVFNQYAVAGKIRGVHAQLL
jgi:hypothetical protein